MKKFAISKFDLGFIIAFVVIGLLGGGAWYYLSTQLTAAQDDVAAAQKDFNTYSTSQGIVVSSANKKSLQDNIDLLKGQLDPLIQTQLMPKDNKLSTVDRDDPVEWKHKLDDKVTSLTKAASLHGVKLPPNFYFTFSRYRDQNPADEQTIVLTKQLLGVEQIAMTMINAPVKGIQAIRRTYEEDSRNAGGGPAPEPDHLAGSSVSVGGGLYTAYPFEIEFEGTTENFRKVLEDLIHSPYVFVVRSIAVQNLHSNSPQLNDLDHIAGAGAGGAPASVIGSAPGEVAAAAPPALGPQFLFGNSNIHVKIRLDMIEWNGAPAEETPAPGKPGTRPPSNRP